MGKLRGVVAGIGMQVTVLLALLWNSKYDPLPPIDGIEPAQVQISQDASDKFRRYKHVCVHIHTRTHIHPYTHTTCAHVHTHAYTHIYAYIHTHTHTHAQDMTFSSV